MLMEPAESYPCFKYAACKLFPLNCRVTHHRHLIVPRKDSTWHIFKPVQVWFSEEVVIFGRLLLARFQSYGQNGPFREELKLSKVWISCLFKCWNYPGLTGGGLVCTRYNLFSNSLLETHLSFENKDSMYLIQPSFRCIISLRASTAIYNEVGNFVAFKSSISVERADAIECSQFCLNGAY